MLVVAVGDLSLSAVGASARVVCLAPYISLAIATTRRRHAPDFGDDGLPCTHVPMRASLTLAMCAVAVATCPVLRNWCC
jgi:hypothetical protein